MLCEQIRFRVRTINFTRVTSTAKGLMATVTSETGGINESSNGQTSSGGRGEGEGGGNDLSQAPVRRRRSTSVGLDNDQEAPSAMQVIGCINEDGLGLTSWWGE